jgi:hydrogenase maturation protein HypF
MLPYAPVHWLLFAEGLGPLVMTSGNRSGQPLCHENHEALASLAPTVDALLLHDRDIVRPVDDSVVLRTGCRSTRAPATLVVRRARGFVPEPLSLPLDASVGDDLHVLALGADLKSTVCAARGTEAVMSEHLGDLAAVEAYRNYAMATQRLMSLTNLSPKLIVVDSHPGYQSRRFGLRLARSKGRRLMEVQHHHAHMVSCMVDNDLRGPVVGLICDGTGYGADGTVWGGEVLLGDVRRFERRGHVQAIRLVGGDAAARETWRPALALMIETFGEEWRETSGVDQVDALIYLTKPGMKRRMPGL